MANTTPKKADTVAAKEVKETKPVATTKPVETKAAEVKAEKAAKPAAPKAEKKPAAKKAAAPKKPAAAAKAPKAAAKKPAAAKAPKAAVAAKVILEYRGKQVAQDDIVAAVKADWKGAAIKTLEIYVKPEDAAAYYVVNGKEGGKVTL